MGREVEVMGVMPITVPEELEEEERVAVVSGPEGPYLFVLELLL